MIKVPPLKTSTLNYIQLSTWGTQNAYFDRFICNDCGYMECYVDITAKGWLKWVEKKLEENSLDTDFV